MQPRPATSSTGLLPLYIAPLRCAKNLSDFLCGAAASRAVWITRRGFGVSRGPSLRRMRVPKEEQPETRATPSHVHHTACRYSAKPRCGVSTKCAPIPWARLHECRSRASANLRAVQGKRFWAVRDAARLPLGWATSSPFRRITPGSSILASGTRYLTQKARWPLTLRYGSHVAAVCRERQADHDAAPAGREGAIRSDHKPDKYTACLVRATRRPCSEHRGRQRRRRN